jgi:hypothetical protein
MPGTPYRPCGDPAAIRPPAPSPDRGRRLVAFGALGLAVGAGALLLGLLNLLLPFAGRLLPEGTAPPPDWRAAATGALTWALIGAAFLWAGVGSMRCRPWARSVMLTLAWSWLLFGLILLVMSWFLLDGLLLQAGSAGDELPPGALGIARLLMLAVVTAGGVVLPLLFVWAYSGDDVRRTCEARHPGADWAAHCPPPVLGLSLGLAACAILGLPMALHAAVPLFGRVVTGFPGAALVLAGSAACLWLARETYRLRRAGFWGTVLFVIGIGASTMATFGVTDPADFLVAYGLPPEQALGMQGAGPAILWATGLVTVASLAYMAAVWRHFAAR